MNCEHPTLNLPTKVNRHILQRDRGAKHEIAFTEGLSMPVSAGKEKKSVAYCSGIYHKQVGLKTIF